MSLFVPLEGKRNSLHSFWGNVSAENPKEASRSPDLCDIEKFDCEFVTSDGTKREGVTLGIEDANEDDEEYEYEYEYEEEEDKVALMRSSASGRLEYTQFS
jgi:hypothetical protein